MVGPETAKLAQVVQVEPSASVKPIIWSFRYPQESGGWLAARRWIGLGVLLSSSVARSYRGFVPQRKWCSKANAVAAARDVTPTLL
jgi:hypothetical protein